jgi:hypothetical protein
MKLMGKIVFGYLSKIPTAMNESICDISSASTIDQNQSLDGYILNRK